MHVVPVVAPNLANFYLNMFQNVWWNVSEICQFNYFWQNYEFSKSSTDSFLTHLGLMTHFRDISKYHLTDFWHSFATDRFMTDIWHILDSFLTDFCNWQFSVTYQTHFWHISEIYGTHTSQEYRKLTSETNVASYRQSKLRRFSERALKLHSEIVLNAS